MSDDRDDASRSTTTTAVARMLHDELATRRPDTDRIQRRVHAGMRPRGHRHGHLRAWGPPLVGAAALAAVVLVVTLFTSAPFGRRSPQPAAPTSGPSTSLRVTKVGPTTITLPDTRGRDWLIAGVAPGDPNQIARDDVTDQLLGGPGATGDPRPTVEPGGPFAARWSGGRPPYADGKLQGSWYHVTAPAGGPRSGFDTRVEPGSGRTELVLYLGVGRAAGRLEVLAGDRILGSATVDPTKISQGYVVTVPLTAVSDGQQVIVRLLAGEGGSVSLAAAVLR
jgi:hypothetical protein